MLSRSELLKGHDAKGRRRSAAPHHALHYMLARSLHKRRFKSDVVIVSAIFAFSALDKFGGDERDASRGVNAS